MILFPDYAIMPFIYVCTYGVRIHDKRRIPTSATTSSTVQVQPYSLLRRLNACHPTILRLTYDLHGTSSYLFPFTPSFGICLLHTINVLQSLQASAFPTISRLRIWSRNMPELTPRACPHDRKKGYPCCRFAQIIEDVVFPLEFVNRLHFSSAVAIYRLLWSRFILDTDTHCFFFFRMYSRSKIAGLMIRHIDARYLFSSLFCIVMKDIKYKITQPNYFLVSIATLYSMNVD